MENEQQSERFDLIKALLTGIFVDTILLSIVGLIDAIKDVFIVVAVIVVARWVLSIVLVAYRWGNLEESELRFVRFGPLVAIWYILKITGI